MMYLNQSIGYINHSISIIQKLHRECSGLWIQL